MTPERQRIAIARACGWVEQNLNDNDRERVSAFWINPGCLIKPLPDYVNDLNAMHEAEKLILDDPMWPRHLHNVTNGGMWGDSWALHATAAQRAEAFLRTIGIREL